MAWSSWLLSLYPAMLPLVLVTHCSYPKQHSTVHSASWSTGWQTFELCGASINTDTMSIHVQMSCNIWKLDIFIFFCIATYTPVCHVSVNNSHLIPQKWNSICFFIIISSSTMSPGLISYASKICLKATSSLHPHCWHTVRAPALFPGHHRRPSAFLFPLSFLHKTLQPLQSFQDKSLYPTFKSLQWHPVLRGNKG